VAKPAKSEPTPEVEPEPTPAKKGHATPTRKEQEAARRRPLVPKDRRLAARQNRANMASEREKARIGMARGDERYLPIRDKGPQKRFVRDYVDARFSAGEVLMPVLVLVILTWFVPLIADYAFLAFWGVFVLVVVDCIVLGFQVTRKLAAKYGKDKVERVRWYAAMRAIQMRFLRLPKPQVKRGEYPTA
jgi:hypothetical protein